MKEHGKIEGFGENINYVIEGEYEKKFSHFGGLDLMLRAIEELITDMDFKFAEENDGEASNKIYTELFKMIAQKIRIEAGFEIPLTDKELILEYINNWKE
ncbi:hypothetical protein [Bacillus cereus group sp. TH152-1LC]|uniref:hypothetical protein n=1 Tax=Bacillus cereus group sp. TH152-1LC TaxID=3018060 RepID=UPI0022E7D494|nr:hypothetical protein [Bacillus cereus group sp. TH152-1LC]MDA1675241.1 hypothetical protein [Bacillus cereus group sp. TH152-1LC]